MSEIQKTHHLKTIPPYFSLVEMGAKTFEFRKNDREYQVGDFLILKEYLPFTGTYSGKEVKVIVTHILENFEGICEGYCILSIRRVS